MNHFFTFLFATYGLAVYGQDNLIGEVYLSFQSSYNTVAIDGCEVGLSYMLQIEGTYGVANGSCNRDAAFGNFGSPTPHCQWVWNDVCDGCQDHRPTPDVYNPDHAYSYPFIAVSSEQTFHFQDLGGAGDNCGGLTMRIFTAGNVGCTSTSACNYESEAVHDDGSCLYPDACGECEGNGLAGCTDALACNFNEDATCDDGGCDYSCCPGPGCCLDGQHWDWELGGCVITNPADINFDGCVQLNDLLDLLSAFGDCGAEESPWQCGDPLEYQGYDYETVQIGEQCWFAENLRAENYSNGDDITFVVEASDWINLGLTGAGVYSYYENDDVNFQVYGGLYNFYAAVDERGLCPSGWSVPSDLEWMALETFIGVPENQLELIEWRASGYGPILMSSPEDNPAWVGTNLVGFNGLPGGYRQSDVFAAGFFDEGALWWSSSQENGNSWFRHLKEGQSGIRRAIGNQLQGFSIRCLKNAE